MIFLLQHVNSNGQTDGWMDRLKLYTDKSDEIYHSEKNPYYSSRLDFLNLLSH